MRAQDLVRLLSLAALWGGSFAFIRVAVPALGPIWLAWLALRDAPRRPRPVRPADQGSA